MNYFEEDRLQVSKKLFLLAKKQFYAGVISKEYYFETLELILKKINDEELKYEQIEILNNIFETPDIKIDLQEKINFALSMN